MVFFFFSLECRQDLGCPTMRVPDWNPSSDYGKLVRSTLFLIFYLFAFQHTGENWPKFSPSKAIKFKWRVWQHAFVKYHQQIQPFNVKCFEVLRSTDSLFHRRLRFCKRPVARMDKIGYLYVIVHFIYQLTVLVKIRPFVALLENRLKVVNSENVSLTTACTN